MTAKRTPTQLRQNSLKEIRAFPPVCIPVEALVSRQAFQEFTVGFCVGVARRYPLRFAPQLGRTTAYALYRDVLARLEQLAASPRIGPLSDSARRLLAGAAAERARLALEAARKEHAVAHAAWTDASRAEHALN